MTSFLRHIKWQFVLLQKNNIVGISLGVTLLYGLILYFFRDFEYIHKLLVGLVLNDPTVIGYFFIALSVYTEIRQGILPAIFVAPVRLHHYLLSRVISLSLIALVCSLLLAFSIRGMEFGIYKMVLFSMGAMGVSILSALLGLIMLTFAKEFLNFAMMSVPIFLIFINIPLLDYLGGIDTGVFRYLFPIQGGLQLMANSLDPHVEFSIPILHSLLLLIWIPLFYFAAFRLFEKKIIGGKR